MKTITKLTLVALLLCGFSFAKAQVPPTAPPQLNYPAEDVLSFFSENYGEAFELSSPGWGQTSTWDYTAPADESEGLIVLTNLEWLPIQLNKDGKLGIAETKAYEYYHIDIYCNEATDFRAGLHANYPSNIECYFPAITKDKMVPGKWYSIDYPISQLSFDAEDNPSTSWIVTSPAGYANTNYLRFGNATDIYTYSDEIYVTNIVLFNGEPTCLGGIVRDGSGISNPENDYLFDVYVSNNSLTCKAIETIKQINVYSLTGQVVNTAEVNNFNSRIDISNLTSGIYVVSAEFANGSSVSKRIIK